MQEQNVVNVVWWESRATLRHRLSASSNTERSLTRCTTGGYYKPLTRGLCDGHQWLARASSLALGVIPA